jgi:hypothetical protein
MAQQVPTNREVIFYCTCPDEPGTAHITRQLMDLGYTRVRPLLGGLDAWIAAGYRVGTRSVASISGSLIEPASQAALPFQVSP